MYCILYSSPFIRKSFWLLLRRTFNKGLYNRLMGLSFLFLFNAAILQACNGLVLASVESQRTRSLEFHSAQTPSRGNSTDPSDSEERVGTTPLSPEDFTPTLLRLPDTFPLASIEEITTQILGMVPTERRNKVGLEHLIRDMLFDPEYLDTLRRLVSIPLEQYLAISLYLILLRNSFRGSVWETAQHINRQMKSKKNAVATLLEEGQFLLWSQVVKADRDSVRRIFYGITRSNWMENVSVRYLEFLRRKVNNQIPGLRDTS